MDTNSLLEAVEALQYCFVRGGGLLGRQALSRDRVNIVTRNGNTQKKCVASHPMIAVGIVVWHEC
jgi:hypothetical protein